MYTIFLENLYTSTKIEKHYSEIHLFRVQKYLNTTWIQDITKSHKIVLQLYYIKHLFSKELLKLQSHVRT